MTEATEPTARVERAIAEIAAGRPVVVVDDHDRENEGDIIVAAAAITPAVMAFTIRYTSGLICVPASGEILDRLELPLMVTRNRDQYRTAYTITVDAATGVGTGISAADRTRTARVLADPSAGPTDLTRPGHVLPLRAVEGGVLARRGHTEAAVDLARLAGLPEAGVLAELVHDDGTLMRRPALEEFSVEHGLVLISIEELAAYRRRTEALVERLAATRLPTRHGDLTAVAYRDRVDGGEHVALVAGELPAAGTVADEPVLARVHSECLTGDVFGSVRCDCGPQLDAAIERIVVEGRGVVVYLRGHEGRGIGLGAKLTAYALQDAGLDTVDANLEQGLPADAREYTVAAQILRDLGMPTLRLLTNNPAKVTGLEAGGATVVERLPLALPPDPRHLAYLRTKRDRMGHDLPHLELPDPPQEDAPMKRPVPPAGTTEVAR